MSLDIKNISVTFGDQTVLQDLTLPTIHNGEMVALIDRNGAGKSTLLRQMTMLLKRYPEQIQYAHTPLQLNDIGYLPQEHRIHANVTVLELLITTMNIHSTSLIAKQECAELGLLLLQEMGVLHLANKQCMDLSGGESQMVGLAQALINNPKVLLLDEPTSALDMQNQLRLLNFVRAYVERTKACVIMVIHDLNLALQYADNIAVLHQGELFDYGAPNHTVTPELIWDVFNVDAHIVKVENTPIVVMKTQNVH
ncbi:ABC transporter ATP-binding protein [Photobacterium leiognathi]|uniref:ABC transporter ATP-binding protein n=1 Tax=Photobacterium leiognathi TaxID=553611 RepID=UPI002736EBE9|nr:ABC transporter ATP-binding protein [Photobacterium leiognathi]